MVKKIAKYFTEAIRVKHILADDTLITIWLMSSP